MHAIRVYQINSRPEADAISNCMLEQSQFRETWPFMDWIEESVVREEDTEFLKTSLFGIKDDVWRGFAVFTTEKPDNASDHDYRITLKYLYIGESKPE